MRQNLGVAPFNPADTATKSYVDATPGLSVMNPPIGWAIVPQFILTAVGASPGSGYWCYTPVIIGFTGLTMDAFLTYATTAQAGGTGTAITFALHPDDGTGYPDTSVVVATATGIAMTAVGPKVNPLTTAVVLTPGIYWIGVLYYQGSTAPTTSPAFNAISNAIQVIPSPSTVSIGTPNRGYRSTSTSYTTNLPGAKTSSANMTVSTANTVPVVALRRSA